MERGFEMTKGLAALAIAALSLFVPSVAHAGTYPPPPDDLVIVLPVDDSGNAYYIAPGEEFPITLCCFTPGTYVEFNIESGSTSQLSAQALVSSGPLLVAEDGTVTWMVPGLPAGTYTLLVTVDGVTFSIPLPVGQIIPKTGSDATSMLRPAIVLVAAGVVAMMVSYRRRPRPVIDIDDAVPSNA